MSIAGWTLPAAWLATESTVACAPEEALPTAVSAPRRDPEFPKVPPVLLLMVCSLIA